jgi:hypothetical protein
MRLLWMESRDASYELEEVDLWPDELAKLDMSSNCCS